MSALLYHGVDLDVVCPLCSQLAESQQHLLFDCPQVTPLWNGITLSSGVTMTFANWLESIISAGPMAMVFRCVATCWGIWRGRNDQIWNNKPWQLSRVRAEIDHLVDSWTQSLSSLVSVAEQPLIVGSELSGGVDRESKESVPVLHLLQAIVELVDANDYAGDGIEEPVKNEGGADEEGVALRLHDRFFMAEVLRWRTRIQRFTGGPSLVLSVDIHQQEEAEGDDRHEGFEEVAGDGDVALSERVDARKGK
nr:ubiquitin carboxyl-terminal hydrolase [Ipomoea batatas]